jgi:hypothetical protein
MIKKICSVIACLVCALLILTSSYAASDIRVTGLLDKQTVDVDDELRYTIQIVGDVTTASRPQLPPVPGFDVHYVNRTSNFRFLDGESVPEVNYMYVFVPQSVGTYTIPSFDVILSGTRYTTLPLDVTVVSLSNKNERTQPYRAPYVGSNTNMPFTKDLSVPDETIQVTENSAPRVMAEDANVFARLEVDPQTAYPNQQITLLYRIYVNADYAYTAYYKGFYEEPVFESFWVEDLTDEKSLKREEIFIKGKRFLRADVKKLALFPIRSGDFELPPVTIRVEIQKVEQKGEISNALFDDNFSGTQVLARREVRQLETAAYPIRVNSFPMENKAETFNGVSGDFKMTAFADKTEVKINEPIVVTVVIEGKGNIETLSAPSFPQTTKDFTLFETRSTTEKNIANDQVRGKKTFQCVFLPSNVGDLEIPIVSFDYFSTKYTKYMVLQRGPFPVNVKPLTTLDDATSLSKVRIVPDELKSTVQLESNDIRYIKREWSNTPRKMKVVSFLLLGIDFFLLIVTSAVLIIKKRESVFDADPTLKRKHFAYYHFSKRLKELHALKKKKSMQFFELAMSLMNSYFADIFNSSPHGLTFETVVTKLKTLSVSDECLAHCQIVYSICNQIKYASSQTKDEAFKTVSDALIAVVDHVEKVVKNG